MRAEGDEAKSDRSGAFRLGPAAVRAANASQFGFSGNIWTGDVEKARKVARELYTGRIFNNGVTATDPRVRVGGVKNSG